MTPAQIEALKNVCKTQEQLQVVWDKARHFKFPGAGKAKVALVTLAVVEEKDGLKWTSCVRLYNKHKQKFKRTGAYFPNEKLSASRMLDSELLGVGDGEKEENFTTKHGIHRNRALTAEEKKFVLFPQLLGNSTNGHRPVPVITNPREAQKLVDKLVKDAEETEKPRIITPGDN